MCRAAPQTKVRTWTPGEGPFHGFLVTHNEAISIADFFTLRDDAGAVVHRPTVHYAYHPCDAAVASLHELAGKNFEQQEAKRLIVDEVRLNIIVHPSTLLAAWIAALRPAPASQLRRPSPSRR